ncbi:retrovirus-related Pol polyprotein from transposon TNT 1-94 [Trichonephila clavipes]|nr:retrovirus-related Pol polyprotein from transposon TNT 1-94 [Trichonephila clavipes]
MDKITIPDLNGTNYFIWELKMKAALSLKRLAPLILEDKPEDLTRKDEMDWITKNSDAIAYIKLSLADEQALQFAAEDNAKVLWDKIRATYMGEGEDRKIDAGNELKNIRMKNGETVADYIARARGISTKCHSLGLDVSPRELVYHTVRGLNGKFSKVRDILKTQRGKSMDEILQILREEEATLNLPIKTRMDGINEAFYCKRKNEKQTRLCYSCRKSNHLAKDCYYRNKNSPSTSQRNNSSRNGHVFTASHREEKPCDNIWILDSGASCHMAKEPVWFKNISPEVMDIYLADKNSKMMSQGTGNVSAKTVSTKHCNSINLTITDVSYVPQLRCNLLSVTCLMDKGCKIKSENNCVLIYDKNDKLITKAFKNNGRLEIKLEPMYNSECFISDQSTNNYEIWHNRLCHLNCKCMLKMKDYIDIDNVNNFTCETCDISKVTRKTHHSIDIYQSSQILELLHADLCGPINIESHGGAKYFMVIVDDFSGMYFTYFLKNKYEVFDIFSQFKAKYENLTDKRIKKIRTDNGLEFVNEQLDTYLANSGIFHEKTIPYNSESNGKAERANRVLLERARSLLYESKLPLKFWAEAINCSTQVSNVTPRKGKEKIPLEIWTGNKPKLNYLKKFGCVAYFHVPKVLRNKFEVPGRRGIMLGYARERRGYRIYDIKNQKVIEERSVKFNEYLKGSNYLGEIENETWDIDSFFEVSPERNEINQNTENGVLYNFDINNGPGAIENDNSIPLQTTSSPRTGRIQIQVLELNDVQNQIPVRRSERLKSKLMSVHLVNNVPNSYFEAENSANWKNWKLAMENELDSLDKHKVWEIVQKPAKSKLIKTKWVYSLKQDDAGKNIKYKARLVAAGFNQIKNIDYSESYSPVVNIESFRLLIALAAKLKLNVNFFDVKTAYLYGDLEETVYVLPPPGYEKLIGDDKVCKLKKSIYGLPQSGRNWYTKIKGELENFGLKQLASDNCVFIKSVNQSVLILCMYVDDLAIFCNNDKMYEGIVSKIKNVFEVVENKTNKFLGMEIEKCENGIYLSQCDYINSLLVKHNLENCKSVKTPIVKGEDKIFPSTNEFIDITMYQELIGELLYLANRTRPDISFVISYLS